MKNAMGLIFGNIHEKEIPEITAYRTLGSVPFGGRYRLIDFVLSNMANSGISKVGIITKKNYQSLMRHVGSGKCWDMSRKSGGLRMLPPFGDNNAGVYSSRFEALQNNINYLVQADEDYVVMSDCDTVCNFDFDDALSFHIRKNADITLIYRKKDLGIRDDKLRTVLSVNADGMITSAETREHLSGLNNVYTNMLIVGRTFLINYMSHLNKSEGKSFTDDVLIKSISKVNVCAYELNGYFASIDSIPNYYKHSLELLNKKNRDMLFDNMGAKIFTKVHDSPPCKIGSGAIVSNSLIADGCIIEGEVCNSILFRGVKVAKNAKITNSIIFQDCIIAPNSILNCVIADKNCRILEDRVLSGHETHPYYISKNITI